MADIEPARLRLELHSFFRGVPMSVDDEAAFELQSMGLVSEKLPWSGGTHEFRITDAGRRRMAETVGDCKVPHCPCHGVEL